MTTEQDGTQPGETSEFYSDVITAALKHSCGGIFEAFATHGTYGNHIFRCSDCGVEALGHVSEEWSARQKAKSDAQTQQFREQAASLPPPPPPIRQATQEEAIVLRAYEWWSEDVYRASFYSPNQEAVRHFLESMSNTFIEADYELDMLHYYAAERPR